VPAAEWEMAGTLRPRLGGAKLCPPYVSELRL